MWQKDAGDSPVCARPAFIVYDYLATIFGFGICANMWFMLRRRRRRLPNSQVAQTGDGFLNFTSIRRENSGWYKCSSRHLNFQYSSIGYYLSVRCEYTIRWRIADKTRTHA